MRLATTAGLALVIALGSLNLGSLHFGPASCLAATYYVNNLTGNDRATGLADSPTADDGPLQTLAAGMALAGYGDRLVIANTGEPYREMLSLGGPRHGGSSRKPFVIEGNGAVLDGTVSAPPGAWRHVEGDVFAMSPRRLTYQQLFRDGRPLERNRDATSYNAAAILQPLEWNLVGGEIFFRVEPGRPPGFYELRHAGLQTGITLYNVRHVRIENLVLQGFQQDGLNAHELVKDCELIDVECRANGRSGLSVGGVSEVRVLRGNFYDNGRVQVRTEGLAVLILNHCDIATNSAPAFRASGRSFIVDGEPVEAP